MRCADIYTAGIKKVPCSNLTRPSVFHIVCVAYTMGCVFSWCSRDKCCVRFYLNML